ncbi:hypothetical protein G7068_08350 [Leucobacter viscericola]|uniref:Uncharacterized protein n=1 Tax=Leucobacter viscericola TaxID=2714935 RepID=A0A6G7XFG0_9MICO|nr:DUF6882 domain-containing protein [Leucobacter viscericola]QIK63206.1 hypothetical protein G7068_08350 [Leucobacter viscericola]
MGLFGKKRTASKAADDKEKRVDRSSIAAVLQHLEAERDSINARAADQFGLDHIEEWAVDLNAGTITFATPSGRWVGVVDVLGSLNAGAESWMWGWANPNISDDLTVASFGVMQFGKSKSIPSLTTMTLWADEREADSLAALAFGYAESQFLFKTPSDPTFYFAVREIHAA